MPIENMQYHVYDACADAAGDEKRGNGTREEKEWEDDERAPYRPLILSSIFTEKEQEQDQQEDDDEEKECTAIDVFRELAKDRYNLPEGNLSRATDPVFFIPDNVRRVTPWCYCKDSSS